MVKVSQPAGEQLRRLLCLGSSLGASGLAQAAITSVTPAMRRAVVR